MSLRIKHKHSDAEQARVANLIAAAGQVHRRKVSLSLPAHKDFAERNHNHESISEINKELFNDSKQVEQYLGKLYQNRNHLSINTDSNQPLK